jgi:phage-related baseplate assembly protein
VQVLVWPHTHASNPQDLRLAVHTALHADHVHTLGVTVTVALAKPRALNVTAQIWRDAMAPADLATRAVAHLGQALPTYARLGRAVPRSWITSQLHAVGCAAVQYPDPNTPAEQTPLAWDEYPAAGTLVLTDMGVML